MNLLAGIGLKVWGYALVAVGVVGAIFAVFKKGERVGKDGVTAKVNEETAGANTRMLDAAVNAPKEKSGVAQDARTGKF